MLRGYEFSFGCSFLCAKPTNMKTKLLLSVSLLLLLLMSACSGPRYYTNNLFEKQTAHHKVIAILPAEVIYTGKIPKELSPEDIQYIEDTESKTFQNSLYNSIMRHANTRSYFTRVNVLDISTTQKMLETAGVSLRDSWKEDDKKLAKILGVDAIVRLRIQQKRYMSDLASMGVDVGRRILYRTSNVIKLPIPSISNKTADLVVSCDVVSNNLVLWNDNSQRGTDYNTPSDKVIEEITDIFSRHFPYKQRNS